MTQIDLNAPYTMLSIDGAAPLDMTMEYLE